MHEESRDVRLRILQRHDRRNARCPPRPDRDVRRRVDHPRTSDSGQSAQGSGDRPRVAARGPLPARSSSFPARRAPVPGLGLVALRPVRIRCARGRRRVLDRNRECQRFRDQHVELVAGTRCGCDRRPSRLVLVPRVDGCILVETASSRVVGVIRRALRRRSRNEATQPKRACFCRSDRGTSVRAWRCFGCEWQRLRDDLRYLKLFFVCRGSRVLSVSPLLYRPSYGHRVLNSPLIRG